MCTHNSNFYRAPRRNSGATAALEIRGEVDAGRVASGRLAPVELDRADNQPRRCSGEATADPGGGVAERSRRERAAGEAGQVEGDGIITSEGGGGLTG
jgi:hypothetical protein